VTDERDVAWVKARLTDMPRKCMRDPLHLTNGATGAIKGAFILCTKAGPFAEAGERAKQRGYRYVELLSGGHDVMVTQPNALAKTLQGLI